MTDFRVSADALDRAADGIDGVADGMRGVVDAMTPPDPLMFGMLIGPVASILATSIHGASRLFVLGMAGTDRGLARNLRGTAADYRQQEQQAIDWCRAFEGDI